MRKANFALLSSLCLALLWITGAHAAGEVFQTLRAATVNDVINDMLIATRTRKPTIIRVAPGHYLFGPRTFASYYDPSLLPMVSTTIEIIGKDPATTIFDGGPSSPGGRFFTVLRGGYLSVYNLTLENGSEVCSQEDCTQLGGGAALNAGGELDFHDCVLQNNTTYESQGGPNGGGGAILNRSGLLVLIRSTVTGNVGEPQGGGLVFLGGAGDIWNSTISGNREVFSGGGDLTSGSAGAMLVESRARVDIHDSTISGNSGGEESHVQGSFSAPGIENHGVMTLAGTSVTENFSQNMGVGGGILNSGSMLIENSTIGGNIGGSVGGGIFNSGHLELQGVTITGNSVSQCFEGNQSCPVGGGGLWNAPGATVIMATTAIGGNSGIDGNDCNGVLTSKGHNAVADTTACTLTPSASLAGHPTHDLANLDLRLGQLQDNGVPGNGHYAPLAGSPLIDSGGAVGPTCTELDQLGQRRVDGDNDRDGANICDIGAIEFQPAH
jgi:hypothetical protein